MAWSKPQTSAYGSFFLEQGRPEFNPEQCICFCIVKYQDNYTKVAVSEKLTRETSAYKIPSNRNLHTEELVLAEIERKERAANCFAITMELYGSLSPCVKCCGLIEKFLNLRPWCDLQVSFSSVHRSEDRAHRVALRHLSRHRGVRSMKVFCIEDWRLLESRDFVRLSPLTLRKMRDWDDFWRDKLNAILSQQDNAETAGVERDTAEVPGPSLIELGFITFLIFVYVLIILF